MVNVDGHTGFEEGCGEKLHAGRLNRRASRAGKRPFAKQGKTRHTSISAVAQVENAQVRVRKPY
jgi:hypothetical protein